MSDNDRESDVRTDEALANSRETGGIGKPSDNQASTTDTSEDAEYVGRIAGDDVGYAGETGAERRAEG